jgi:hypothetical protein
MMDLQSSCASGDCVTLRSRPTAEMHFEFENKGCPGCCLGSHWNADWPNHSG